MIFYLTYNDLPSGIYSSQVIDVVNFLNKKFDTKVKLIALISIRGFLKNRKKIKTEIPESIILPMFPGVHRWKKNMFLLNLLCFIKKPEKIIGRSVIATQLALKLKGKGKTQKVFYDGRGAITAEWKEYNVVINPQLKNEIFELEKNAIHLSDYRIAVSEQLVLHWKNEFDYCSNSHVIIPCTLNKVYEKLVVTEEVILNARKTLGIKNNEIVFVYSGSIAGWQSFELLYQFLKPILNTQNHIKVLFLSDKDANIEKLQNEFKDKIICRKVMPNEVPNLLVAADYGLLIREQTITNKVASPVKFAEYLACGLKVIISEELGDYSGFIKKNKCGHFPQEHINYEISSIANKSKINQLSISSFTKNKFEPEYRKLLNEVYAN